METISKSSLKITLQAIEKNTVNLREIITKLDNNQTDNIKYLSECLAEQFKLFEIILGSKVENIESKVDDNRPGNNTEKKSK